MPFDGAIFDAKSILVSALRGELPEGFHWDFTFVHRRDRCGSVGCAIGLAFELGLISHPTRIALRDEMGVSLRDSECLSADEDSCRRFYRARPDRVTPEMVAEKLEAIFATNA